LGAGTHVQVGHVHLRVLRQVVVLLREADALCGGAGRRRGRVSPPAPETLGFAALRRGVARPLQPLRARGLRPRHASARGPLYAPRKRYLYTCAFIPEVSTCCHRLLCAQFPPVPRAAARCRAACRLAAAVRPPCAVRRTSRRFFFGMSILGAWGSASRPKTRLPGS
jgi:hypothetical protein